MRAAVFAACVGCGGSVPPKEIANTSSVVPLPAPARNVPREPPQEPAGLTRCSFSGGITVTTSPRNMCSAFAQAVAAVGPAPYGLHFDVRLDSQTSSHCTLTLGALDDQGGVQSSATFQGSGDACIETALKLLLGNALSQWQSPATGSAQPAAAQTP